MMKKQEILFLLKDLSRNEKIDILESLCKQLRRENSKMINAKQMGRRVDSERPDLQLLK